MKRAIIAGLALAISCSHRPTEAALLVTVKLDADLASLCAEVVVQPLTGAATHSGPVVLSGKTVLHVGVAQGELPDSVIVFAQGFSDAACTAATQPPEHSNSVSVTFVKDEVQPIALELTANSTLHETSCADGIDNDMNGLIDCADPSCASRPCANGGTCALSLCTGARSEAGLCDDGVDNDMNGLTDCADPACVASLCRSSNRCFVGAVCDSTGGCDGGLPKTCTTPDAGCRAPSGTCDPTDGLCAYAPADAGTACDDHDLCTQGDACKADGTCAGTALACTTPPNGCFTTVGATCVSNDGGCTYPIATSQSCDDGNACTQLDQCQRDGGCSGEALTCTPAECQAPASVCSADAGCLFASLDAGTSCNGDAGTCNGSGVCVPHFVLPPSNFTETQLPNLPTGGVVLDCGETTIDTVVLGAPVFTNWCPGQPLPGVAIIAQPGGSDAVLLSFTTLSLSVGAKLHVRGTRPLIIGAVGDVSISGDIDTLAGSDACLDGGAGGNGTSKDTNGGGAGGSLSTAGANGGGGVKFGTAGAAGVAGAVGTNEQLIPLMGGCPGGIGGGGRTPASSGGGALQISTAGALVLSGTLNAPGQGGAGGPASYGAGNGGGSGGAILLEATTLTITGAAAIGANGGGGSEGAGVAFSGASGGSGTPTTTPASGGNSLNGGASGGNGAAGTTTAGKGDDGQLGGAGGGGGGLGRIRVRAGVSCSIVNSAVLSPPANTDAGC